MELERDRRRKRLSRKKSVEIPEYRRRRRGARFGRAPGQCGVITTLSNCSSSGSNGGTAGSPSRTSRPAPADALLSQRIDQRGRIHHRAAPDVDEIAVRPERSQHFRVDEVSRRRSARRGADQEVGPLRELDRLSK